MVIRGDPSSAVRPKTWRGPPETAPQAQSESQLTLGRGKMTEGEGKEGGGDENIDSAVAILRCQERNRDLPDPSERYR